MASYNFQNKYTRPLDVFKVCDAAFEPNRIFVTSARVSLPHPHIHTYINILALRLRNFPRTNDIRFLIAGTFVWLFRLFQCNYTTRAKPWSLKAKTCCFACLTHCFNFLHARRVYNTHTLKMSSLCTKEHEFLGLFSFYASLSATILFACLSVVLSIQLANALFETCYQVWRLTMSPQEAQELWNENLKTEIICKRNSQMKQSLQSISVKS